MWVIYVTWNDNYYKLVNKEYVFYSEVIAMDLYLSLTQDDSAEYVQLVRED